MDENNDLKTLELDHPHGFLIWRGKQTALGTPESLPVGEKLLVVSGGEAFGYVTLKEPARMKASEFDREEYQKEHRLYPTEWRLDWPDTKTLNLYRFESWEPFEKAMPFEGGEIITDEPTPHEAALIDRSRYLPKTLVLNDEAITMTGGKFTIADGVPVSDDLKQILQTTYETEVEFIAQKQSKYLPLYRLALVRVPNMRVKKNAPEPIDDSGAEATSGGQVQVQQDIPAVAASDPGSGVQEFRVPGSELRNSQTLNSELLNPELPNPELPNSELQTKQEDDMPYRKVRDHADCPDDKPVGLVNRETGKLEGCHANMEDADAQIAAMHAGKAAAQEIVKELTAMPFPNEHAARIHDPDKYERHRRQNNKFGSGIDVIFGVLPGGKTEVQAIRFDKSKFTPARARQWLKDNGYKPIEFEEATGKMSSEDMGEDSKMGDMEMPMEMPDMPMMYPGATSFAELMEAEHAEMSAHNVHKFTAQFEMMVKNILDNPMIEDKPAAINGLVEEYGALVNETMTGKKQWQPLTDMTKKAIKKIFKKDKEEAPEPGSPLDGLSFDKPFSIAIKTVSGEPWHLNWSTNAFRDRDREIFTTKALENYVTESEQIGYKGFFNFWHIPGTDFAVKEWKAVIGRFLIEAGPYLDNEAGRQAKVFFQQYSNGHPDFAPEGWGASPEFNYLPEERAKDGIFHWLWIPRTSTLRRSAAANIWTKGMSVMAMTKDQEQAAIAIFGKNFVERLKAEAEKETAALEQVADHKAAETPEESEKLVTVSMQVEDESEEAAEEKETEGSESDDGKAAPIINIPVDELAAEVKKQFEFDLQPVAEAMAEILAEVKAVSGRVTKLEKTEATKQQVETPRFLLNLVRASQAEETALTENDELKGKKPKEPSMKKDGTLMSSFFNPK